MMKKFLIFFCVSLFLLLSAVEAFAYIHPSLRIKSLGDEFVGIIDDSYTNIYRNPAYLSYVKRIKIFGQYNNYYQPPPPYIFSWRTEITYPPIIGTPEYRQEKEDYSKVRSRASTDKETDIQGYFHNRNTALGGIVLPVYQYGSLALVGELKPDEKSKRSSDQKRYLYTYYYIDESYFTKSSEKTSINNFKAIYGIKLSPHVRAGLDYTYLKNNNFNEFVSESRRLRKDIDTDILRSVDRSKRDSFYDNSPDLHRGSIGIILKPKRTTRLDLNLHYESISHNDTSHHWSEYTDSTSYADTLWRYTGSLNQNKRNYKHRIKSWGVDVNIKYNPNYRSTITFLVSGRFQKNDITGYFDDLRTSWIMPNMILYSTSTSGTFKPSENKDKIYSLAAGSGIEHDFSRSIKFCVALIGYWDKIKVRREQKEIFFREETKFDAIVYSDTTEWERKTNVSNDNFRVVLPVCVEAKFHKMIKGRLGGMLVYQDIKDLDKSSTTSLKAKGSLGVGFSYKRKIYMDVFAQDDINEIESWMVNIGYNF